MLPKIRPKIIPIKFGLKIDRVNNIAQYYSLSWLYNLFKV